MRKLKLALAMLMVLAMASTSFATITLQVVGMGALPEKVQDKVLTRWIVRAVSDGNDINTLTNPMLYGGTVGAFTSTGEVHQCYTTTSNKTVFGYQISDGLADPDVPWGDAYGWTDDQTQADTHLLVFGQQTALLFNGSNPLKENTVATTKLNAFGYTTTGSEGTIKSGLGTWQRNDTTKAYDYSISIKNDMSTDPPTVNYGKTMDLMQVVLERGTVVFFSGRVLGPNAAPQDFTDVVIGVPEPSTIVMLLVGGLCLVGYRLRRK